MARITKFGRPSQRPSIIFALTPPPGATAESMRANVGKTYFVEWPYLREAYIKSVSDQTGAIVQMSEGIKTVTYTREESEKWLKDAALERDQRLTSSGLDIGPVEVLMQVVCVRVCVYIHIHIYIYMYTYICVDIYVCMYTAPKGDQRLTSSGLDIGPVEVLMQVVCVQEREYICVYIYCARRRSETDVVGS